jgi:hypothetical protein
MNGDQSPRTPHAATPLTDEVTNSPWVDWEDSARRYKALAERLEGVASDLRSLLVESRKWQAEGEYGDPLGPESWTPEYADYMKRLDAVIAGMPAKSETGRITELESKLAAMEAALKGASNYIADSETHPQRIEFADGRVVAMKGTGYLYVSRKAP